MDSEHATRRRISQYLATDVHMSPIATILTVSSSLVNSLMAGVFTEWDGNDITMLEDATSRLLESLTMNTEPLLHSATNGEMGFLLCKTAILMIKERDLYVAHVLTFSLMRSLRDAGGTTGRYLYYNTLISFLFAFCYLEMEEYAVTVYSLCPLIQIHCLSVVHYFREYLESSPIQLEEFIQLLYLVFYASLMLVHTNLLHECYVLAIYVCNLLVDVLMHMGLMTVSTSMHELNDVTFKERIKYIQLPEDKRFGMLEQNGASIVAALLDDITAYLADARVQRESICAAEKTLQDSREQFILDTHKLIDSNIADRIIHTISQKNGSPVNNIKASDPNCKIENNVTQLYIMANMLRELIESSTGTVLRLRNVTLTNTEFERLNSEMQSFINALLHLSTTILIEDGVACSIKCSYREPWYEKPDRPEDKEIKDLLGAFKACSKSLREISQLCPLLNLAMIKSVCAMLCAYLMLVPTKSGPVTIQLGNVLDALGMLSTHCTYDHIIIYASLEILNMFVIANCSTLLLQDISVDLEPRSFPWGDVLLLPIRKVSSSIVSYKDTSLRKINEQVPKRSFSDDLDGWIEAIVEIMCTIPRQSIMLTAELVALMHRLVKKESLTLLRLHCPNDDRRVQLLKYLRYLWLLAQSYRDRILCTHQRLQGLSYAAHTLPYISNSFVQRERSFFPLQALLLDLFVVDLEW